jgi:hypothetical protein
LTGVETSTQILLPLAVLYVIVTRGLSIMLPPFNLVVNKMANERSVVENGNREKYDVLTRR